MNWMFGFVRRRFDFNGRARRAQFWIVVSTMTIASLSAQGLFGAGGPWRARSLGGAEVLGWIAALANWVMIVPLAAVAVRRLHDQDRSGWLLLCLPVPMVGLILWTYFCLRGTRGPNRFGPDPNASPADVFK